MSVVEVRMCDIKGCRAEAYATLPTMLVCRQEDGDGSFTIYSEVGIDLCGKHDGDYRRMLPDWEIERKGSTNE